MIEYIEREELLRIEKLLDTDILRASKTANTIYDQILYDIENFSAADVAPVVHGKWVEDGDCEHKPCRVRDVDKWKKYKCSNCGYKAGRCFNYNYCPNCGAKMDLEG